MFVPSGGQLKIFTQIGDRIKEEEAVVASHRERRRFQLSCIYVRRN